MMRLVAIGVFLAFAVLLLTFGTFSVRADPEADALSAEARQTLVNLYGANPKAAVLGKKAQAVLVFPHIKKAALTARPFAGYGGGYGEGALIKQGATTGFYHFASSRWPRQGSEATFSLVVFLMTPEAQQRLAGGIDLKGAQAVMLAGHDLPSADGASTQNSYVLAFDDHGAIETISLNDSKVTPIEP